MACLGSGEATQRTSFLLQAPALFWVSTKHFVLASCPCRHKPIANRVVVFPVMACTMIGTLCSYLVAIIFLGYLVPHLLVAWFFKTKNLKKAYDAKWALVTGSSSGEPAGGAIQHAPTCRFPCCSQAVGRGDDLTCPHPPRTGIGKAIAKKLALQGLNVVMVAFPDDTLDAAFAELKEAYPKVQFKKVGEGVVAPERRRSACWCRYREERNSHLGVLGNTHRAAPPAPCPCRRSAPTWASPGTWTRSPVRRGTLTSRSSSATPATCSPASSTACAWSPPPTVAGLFHRGHCAAVPGISSLME